MEDLKVVVLQSKIIWEDRSKNRSIFEDQILPIDADVDIIVLPEMFSTGFTMNIDCAETMDGETIQWMKKMAAKKTAVLCGSLIVKDQGKTFNRLIWATQDGEIVHYDKRHLFSYANEHLHFTQGTQKKIVHHKGWRFLLSICYDLRFPVSMRNQRDYDAIVLVANWPNTRAHHWQTLIKARAIENQSYVLACNRVGVDNNDLEYQGDSAIIKPDGEIVQTMSMESAALTATISKSFVDDYRETFAFAQDAVPFVMSKDVIESPS